MLVQKNKQIQIKLAIIIFFILSGFSLNLFYKKKVQATDCDLLDGSARDECKKLEQKAEEYREVIDAKQQQQNTLNNQISVLNAEIQSLTGKIKNNEKKISELNNDIIGLEKEISTKEKTINKQTKILSEIIRSYYEMSRGKQAVISAFFDKNFFGANFTNKDNVSKFKDVMADSLANIVAMKKSLEDQVKKLEGKKLELAQKQNELSERNSDVRNTQEQKDMLLAQTKGEEEKYQKLLERVEAQKLELLGDIDTLFTKEINDLFKSLPKPTTGTASLSWYYSQKDPSWGNKTIGQSSSLMKDYGCAISSASMVFTKLGESINPGQLAKKPIFSWDLISWPKSWGSVDLVLNTNHTGVNWSKVDSEIKSGNPVIVFISAKGRAGHYVVVHGKDKNGKYVVHDPYFGPNIYLDSTIKLLAAMYNVSIPMKAVDQLVLYKK